MPGTSRDRHLATFLFLDIVGSTTLAAELGDHRWKDLLGRFRRILHREIKAHGGTVREWTGDGVFATFPDPRRALRAATAITEAVHEVGVDVRCGVHTGEAEIVDGKYAGLGVHLAARVMSLGGAADVLVSSTVRDLMTGSSARFEDRGVHELKGIPDDRQVFKVIQLDDRPAADPLAPEVVAARVAAIEPLVAKRRTSALVVGGAFGLIAVVIAVMALTQGGSSGAGAGGTEDGPVTLVELDASTGKTLRTLHDDAYSEHLWEILSVQDGSLWQATPTELVQRDPETGAIEHRISLPAKWNEPGGGLDGGFNYIWAADRISYDVTEVHRINPDTGKDTQVRFDSLNLESMATGNGAVWLLDSDGTLNEMDPTSMKIVASYDTGAITPGRIVPIAGYVWICECQIGRVAQFDPRRGEIVSEQTLPEHGFVFGVESTSDANDRVWLLDPDHNTLTPLDATTGKPGIVLGIGGAQITDATIVGDELWVASQTQVTKIDLLNDFDQHPFDVPPGVSAGSVAPTPDGETVWVANCGCPIQG